MSDGPVWSPRTQAVQALGAIDETTGAIVPPVHIATTFIRDPDNAHRRGYEYARPDNPTARQVEAVLQTLEGGAAAMLFGSGMAAATSLFLALEPGSHIVAPRVMYWGLRQWLAQDAGRHGLEVTFVDTDDPAALRAALRPGRTQLVWIETPANPLWSVTDIADAAEAAHGVGALLAVDSTVATPVLSRPLDLAADLVMHSATKYLNGHSDVLSGALVTARTDDFWARIATNRSRLGPILGPFEAALLLRGLRTLHLRVDAACTRAQFLAERLAAQPAVRAVLYPGLPDHPGHAVARRQMHGGFGGMLSIRLANEAAAIGTAARVRLWKRATSLGGVESLIEHRASVEGPDSPVPPDLLRLSVGIEDPADLLADLEAALAAQ